MQVRCTNRSYFSVGNRFPLNYSNTDDIEDYKNFLEVKFDILQSKYKTPLFEALIFNYTFIDNSDYVTGLRRVKGEAHKFEYRLEDEAPANLPLNTNYFNWGKAQYISDGRLKITDINFRNDNNKDRYFLITQYDSSNALIEVFSSINNRSHASITDKIVSSNTKEFVRKVNNKHYHIKGNVVFFLFENIFPGKYITKANAAKNPGKSAMTLDIETFKDSNNQMQIYCLSFFDGKDTFSYYITDYKNVDAMVAKAFKRILARKYRNSIVYIHNSSNFDLIFLLKHLASLGVISLDSVVKDGKFINLVIFYGKQGSNNVTFRYSMLLLPASLSKLCKTFNVKSFKDIFPHNFVNKDNLNYEGDVPLYEFFDS